eukprot:TRINITY_DN7994_c0_g2_i1.p2 TRINITY_DN7994_c0_g2~~TRINITY_DN7994_c0_g2_i1.p2  ORF type:complete len:295 (-),score=85.99 TRINITY_DN7994_c0_g2_i1:290-1174(-)
MCIRDRTQSTWETYFQSEISSSASLNVPQGYMEDFDPEIKAYFFKIKEDIKKEHVEYLKKHPEIREVLNDFVSSLLLQKPDDIYAYARDYFSYFNHEKDVKKQRPFVIAGPAGVGKGTLVKMLLQKYPEEFELSVSYTTRKPRATETDGVEYFFVAKDEFVKEIERNSFVEHCEVHGNFYGTHKGILNKIMNKGKVCILEIDVVGAEKVNKSGIECNYLWLDPPSIDEIRKRIIGRGSETPETLEKRLKTAERELLAVQSMPFFEHKLVNNDINETFENLLTLLRSLYPELGLQ